MDNLGPRGVFIKNEFPVETDRANVLGKKKKKYYGLRTSTTRSLIH